MSLIYRRPDLREFNGRTRSEAVEIYFRRYGIQNSRLDTVWSFQLPNNWEVEIIAQNLSDEFNKLFRPVVRYRILGYFPWTMWPKELSDHDNSYEAKKHAFIKLMVELYPNVIRDLFPKALTEESGISKYLN